VVRVRSALEIFQMAAGASRAGQVVVVVDMAIETHAGRIGVRVGQREANGVVVEGCRLPRNRGVALLTGLREPSRNVVRIRGALKIFQMA